jgi:hypothetical protein
MDMRTRDMMRDASLGEEGIEFFILPPSNHLVWKESCAQRGAQHGLGILESFGKLHICV